MNETAPKLLDLVRLALRRRHYSMPTERAYCHWIRRFILFHAKRHPGGMGRAEVRAFLDHLARDRNVSPSTQNQALAALLFLYNDVLAMRLLTPSPNPRPALNALYRPAFPGSHPDKLRETPPSPAVNGCYQAKCRPH